MSKRSPKFSSPLPNEVLLEEAPLPKMWAEEEMSEEIQFLRECLGVETFSLLEKYSYLVMNYNLYGHVLMRMRRSLEGVDRARGALDWIKRMVEKFEKVNPDLVHTTELQSMIDSLESVSHQITTSELFVSSWEGKVRGALAELSSCGWKFDNETFSLKKNGKEFLSYVIPDIYISVLKSGYYSRTPNSRFSREAKLEVVKKLRPFLEGRYLEEELNVKNVLNNAYKIDSFFKMKVDKLHAD